MTVFYETPESLYSKGKELFYQAIKEKDEAPKNRLYKEAAELFEKAMKKGYSGPMTELGAIYLMGLGREADYNQGFHVSLYAAKCGSAMAANNVAVCYQRGLGTEKDLNEAYRWYLEAAEKGISDAYKPLSYLLAEGKGCGKNLHEARKWGRKALQQGTIKQAEYDKAFKTVPEGMSASAAFDIAYEAAQNHDYEEAVAYYSYAAEKGDAGAMNNLALRYETGSGVGMNLEKAYELLKKAMEAGNVMAKCNLGRFYAKGIHVAGNEQKAKYLFVQAMEAGKDTAFKWYKEYYPDEYDGVAARIKIGRGEAEAVDYYHAADLDYRSGDYESALTNALEAYNRGRNLDACILIADAYIHGNGIEQDLINGYRWVLIALSYGLPQKTKNILTAGDYLLTLSQEKNMLPDAEKTYASHTAFALLYLAALKGNDVAELKVATCYINGIGCKCNEAAALRFLKSAAAHGNASANQILNSQN